MVSPNDFVNYPKPVEGPETKYAPPPAKNPVLRGYSLVAASALYVLTMRFPSILRYMLTRTK